MCQAGPRWRPNREIAWHTERLLHFERYTNSKRSPSSNAIIIHSTIINMSNITNLRNNSLTRDFIFVSNTLILNLLIHLICQQLKFPVRGHQD